MGFWTISSAVVILILSAVIDFNYGYNGIYTRPPFDADRRMFSQPPFSVNNFQDRKVPTVQDNYPGCSIPQLELGMNFNLDQCQHLNHHPVCSRRSFRAPIDWTGVISCTFRGRSIKYYSTCGSTGEWNPAFYSNCADLYRASGHTSKDEFSSKPNHTPTNIQELNSYNNSPGNFEVEEPCFKPKFPDDPRFVVTCKVPEAPDDNTPFCGADHHVKPGTRIIVDCRPPYVSRTGHPNIWICKNGKWSGSDGQIVCKTLLSSTIEEPQQEVQIPLPHPKSKPEDPLLLPQVKPGTSTQNFHQLKATPPPIKINHDPQRHGQVLNERIISHPSKNPIMDENLTVRLDKKPQVPARNSPSAPGPKIEIIRFGAKPTAPPPGNVTCPPLLHSSPGVRIECTFRNQFVQVSSCRDPLPIGSEARYSCEDFYETTAGIVNLYRKCREDGTWTGHGDQYGCVVQCGRSNIVRTPYITNGTPTLRGQWPWHAAVFLTDESVMSSKWNYICGGTLISKRAILTAAHCVTFSETTEVRSKNHFRIDLGKFRRERVDEFVQSHEIQHIVVHPSYSPYGYDSDIALVVLKHPVLVNYHVRPICYPQTSDSGVEELQLSDQSVGTVVGWGKDATGNLTDNLHVTGLPVVSPRACLENVQESLAMQLQTRSTTYCAGFTNGTNVCNGDSGGGMYFPFKNSDSTRWYLQGIVSVGIPDRNGKCDPTRYSVFTRVGRYADWIVRQLTEHNA